MTKQKKPASLDAIHQDLVRAGRLLDQTAAKIRNADLNPHGNVRRIAYALRHVIEIQKEIYLERPDLLPALLIDTKFGRKVRTRNRLKEAETPSHNTLRQRKRPLNLREDMRDKR